MKQAKQGKEQSTRELLQRDATTERSCHCDGQKLRQTEATIERRCYGQKPLQSFPSPSSEGCYGLGQVSGSGYWHMQEALRWNRKRTKQGVNEAESGRSSKQSKQEEDKVGTRRRRKPKKEADETESERSEKQEAETRGSGNQSK